MSFIAPNLTMIVGSVIAAKLMGIAGGLTALSKIPSCNLKVLGKDKKTLTGFSSTMIRAHNGAIFNCDLVQQTPPDLRQRALRLISGKHVPRARTRRALADLLTPRCAHVVATPPGRTGARSRRAWTAFIKTSTVRVPCRRAACPP